MERPPSRLVIAILTFGIFMSLTLIGWSVVRGLEERNNNIRFDKVAAEAVHKIEHHFAGYEQVLKGGLGHLLASGSVSRNEWRIYVNALRINDRYPGIHGIGFVRRIVPSELAAHIAEIRAEGFPGYEVWPKGRRREYAPIIYLEPFSGSNLRAFGFDMLSDPVRRAAMSRARDTGEAALSGKVKLVQRAGEDIPAGVLIYVPYYGVENLRETVEERRASLAGYVYARFRMDDFVRAVLSRELETLDLRIFDGEGMKENFLLFDSRKHPPGPLTASQFERVMPISLYGQTWTIVASSRPAFEKAAKSFDALLVLLVGTLVSTLTALMSFVLSVNKEKEMALAHAQLRTERVLESITEAFYTVDREWRFTYVNREAEVLLGRERNNLLGRVIWDEFREGVPSVFYHEFHRARAENTPQMFEEFYAPFNKWFEVRAYPSEEGLAVYFRNITTHKEAEQAREKAHTRIQQQASLLDKAKDAIIVRGMDNCIQFWNLGAQRLYGWKAEEVMGRPIDLLYDSMGAFEEATLALLDTEEWQGEIAQRRKDHSELTVEAHWTLVRDDEGRPQSVLAINTDITQRKNAEKEIQYLAFYDSLTGLPNRQLLIDRLRQAVASGARNRHTGALLFIDLDNFKLLNDTLGHDLGDRLLQLVAPRLISSVRDTDTVARLGGDEFVIILAANFSRDHDKAVIQVETICERIRAAFNDPFRLGAYTHHTTPSIGIALFSDQVHSADELLKHADLAMYQAKASGRNSVRFFDPRMQAEMNARAILEADLQKSWERNEFVLHYQPQVDSSGIVGAEALVRWQHPRRGLLSPAEFIPQAEETGLILPLGASVLEDACHQLAKWSRRAETAGLNLSVNVSSLQFCQSGFVGQVISVLERTGASPHRLKLELTESILVQNMDETIGKMMMLKGKGVGFALDDFGVGYSSLYYLKRLPLDWVKIDQSFVRDMLVDSNDATIVRAILLLAKSMGLGVIAEGVETGAQKDFLSAHGCSTYQGYLFSPPLPLKRFEEFLRKNKLRLHERGLA